MSAPVCIDFQLFLQTLHTLLQKLLLLLQSAFQHQQKTCLGSCHVTITMKAIQPAYTLPQILPVTNSGAHVSVCVKAISSVIPCLQAEPVASEQSPLPAAQSQAATQHLTAQLSMLCMQV